MRVVSRSSGSRALGSRLIEIALDEVHIQGHPDAGSIGDLQVTVVQVEALYRDALTKRVGRTVVLEPRLGGKAALRKVGESGESLQGCSQTDVCPPDVGDDGYMGRACQGDDPGHLGEAAGCTEVGLEHVDGTLINKPSKAKARVFTLSAGDEDVRVRFDLLIAFQVLRRNGLFKPLDPIGFHGSG